VDARFTIGGRHQYRHKRPGQFCSQTRLHHLDALKESRSNGHQEQLWLTPDYPLKNLALA
jgi:hypothetical protein